jgi:type IV pilus assembly protein PilB
MATTDYTPITAALTGTAEEQHEREFASKLAQRYRCPFVDLHEQRIDPELFRTIPADLMFRYNFVPLEVHNNLLSIAVADPSQVLLSDELPLLLGKKLAIKVATAHQISDLLKRTEQSQRVLEQATEAFTLQVSKDEGESDETISGDRLTRDTAVSPVVRLVETVIFTALERRASDIHIEARDSEVAVKYRIDGVLQHAMQPIAKEWHSTVISRIKVLSDLDIAERRVPQDGRFSIALDRRPIDFRVSIIPSIFGEDAVLRALDKQALTERLQGLRLDALGFDSRVVTQVRRLSSLPYGMLLVTGPTGSGKTTTLYAAISETQTGSDKIVTIEDPVEYQLQGVLQIPVNEKKGLTFARGLRSILRHDPDKIMVGEIRDSETAQIAIQSALTGHLVFTTVHANNVFDVVSRFTHMGVDTYSFVSALSGVLAQRLIRIVCEQCAEPRIPSRQLLEESQLTAAASAAFNFTTGRGCQHCRGSGYRGRKAIGELLVLNDELREAIINRVPVRQLKEMSKKGGVRLIRSVALDLVKRGETTLEEVNRVTVMA